jgi:DNA-binding NarL/FixJ family response regulator
MCRALKVLCAAPDSERLAELKRAALSVHWELTGGATSSDELVNQVDVLQPDVVVIDTALGPEVAVMVRERRPTARVVAVGGPLEGADAVADTAGAVKEAIIGMPPVGGPVRS